MNISGIQVKKILERTAKVIDENKQYLTELDAAIGDGDHGLNLHKGFTALVEKIKDEDGNNIGDILKKSGMALVSNVGGAAGPLYGTAFMKAAVVSNGKDFIDINDFLKMLENALSGIKMRGKGELGDKTMIDALEPAINVLRNSIDKKFDDLKILENVKDAAMEGANRTKSIVARKGRASYLGERSLGHQDPGATSMYLILNTIYEEVKKISN